MPKIKPLIEIKNKNRVSCFEVKNKIEALKLLADIQTLKEYKNHFINENENGGNISILFKHKTIVSIVISW